LKEKILIIGGSGLVGSTLANFAKENYEVIITFNKNFPSENNFKSIQLDLLKDKSSIIELIKKINPSVVVHTAAHPSVDLCETNPELADQLHVEVTSDIANICKKINTKLIYLSTDAVFDGNTTESYRESDLPCPKNHYGVTKLLAEKIILNSSNQNVILRTAVIYGWHKKSRFTNWIIDSLQNKKMVDPHVDQYNTPTLVDDLVNAILKIISMNVSGLFHATGRTCVNRFEFASMIAEIFDFDKNLIKPVTSNQKKQLAPRPKHTCLDSNLLEKSINFTFSDLTSGLKFILKQSQNS